MEQDEEMLENASSSLHPNVVLHVDFDYFYAQVEEILNPELRKKPVGVKQRFHIVTCNFKAREFGINKMETIKDALRKCPDLIIINGEDLSKYKTFSKRIAELLHSTIGPSERMDLDEHFIETTKIVKEQMSTMTDDELANLYAVGALYPNEDAFNGCKCGCKQRLSLGSQIAQKLRDRIFKDLQLTCSIGVAHNKLLAKLVGQLNKPNNQTVLAPMAAKQFMVEELKDIHRITGIGSRTASRIQELGITSIADLQKCEFEKLEKKFGVDMAAKLKELSVGCDTSTVKPSGKPKTVGLEDSFRPISIRSDAQEKFRALLSRLVIQIQDDGRVPQSIKVTVRKYDPIKKNSIRETKQCALVSSHFRCVDGKIQLVDGAEDRILKNVMLLFDRMVDLKITFNITLLGLCFSKFQDQRGPGSVANYLMKKQEVEVQSITNLSNESINGSFRDSFRSKTASPSSSVMDYETMSNTSLDFSGSEESELEPSPKKRKKLSILLVAKGRRYSSNDDYEIASPSKQLNVSALQLNGSMDVGEGLPHNVKTNMIPNRVISPLCISNEPVACTSKSPELPPNVDPSVWREFPLTVQREIMMRSWQPPPSSSTKSNTIAPLQKKFIRNT